MRTAHHNNKQMIDKEIIAAFKEDFDGKQIMADALTSIITTTREEALAGARKLYTKKYQTRREIKDLENKLENAAKSLDKTVAKIAKVESGDLSAFFEGNDKKEDDKKDNPNKED